MISPWLSALLCVIPLIHADVQVLTDTNFDSVIAENHVVLVDFYAPWCGHCKKLEPEFEKAADQLEGTGPVLAKVDATVEKRLADRFSIRGFPTIKLFRSGTESSYEGGRSASEIVSYLKKQVGPALKQLETPGDLEAFIPDDDSEAPVVVAFTTKDSNLGKFIQSYADKFRNDFSFGIVTDDTTAGENAMESIVLFTPFDERKTKYTGELAEDAFSEFLTVNSMPSEQEISPTNYAQYMKRGLPISWLFLDLKNEAATERALAEYKKVAPAFKDKLSLVHLDGVAYKQMTQKMGLTGDTFPGLAIDREGEHFVFPEGEDLTESSLRSWFQKYMDGELVPFIKSEPLPDPLFDASNVATVVGNNFKEVVLDDTKDVLVEFYAPWCGHCKKLVPTWEELGRLFKGTPSVIIAKTDATANDYPSGFQVNGFPSIKLVTSKGNKVVNFNGDRTVDGFRKFLKENAGTPFELESKPADEGDDRDDVDDEL